MEAMSPGSAEDEGSPERHHRDDAETIDQLTKEKFRLQLRIYHMEQQMQQTQGPDWKSSMNVKLELDEVKSELEDRLKLLAQSKKVIDQLKMQLDASQKEKSRLTQEKENALKDVSNIESKLRRVEGENSNLKEQLSSTRETSRRNRERIEDDFENAESRLRKTENRLSDSVREKERLAEQLEELERNNNTIDDELNRKYDEVTDLKEENQELLEEIERLRDELDKTHAEKEKHSRRKYNTFEVGVQCETRMCEKAVQTKSVSSSTQSYDRVQPISSRTSYQNSSRGSTRQMTSGIASGSTSSLRRTSSVDNLSTRPQYIPPAQKSSNAYGHERSRDRYSKQQYNQQDRYNELPTRYQTLVQSQSRDLGLLRKQLEQSRVTTGKLRNIIEDLTRSERAVDQRRYIQLARREIRKLEGELEDRGETSAADSDSEFEKEENLHVKSRILPAVLEIRNMVNELREQNQPDNDSVRSIASNSTISLNNLNQKVQESKRLSKTIQDAFEVDSGKATSPMDYNSLSGMHENHLIPGLVQDLQSLRLQLDSSVRRQEKLSDHYKNKIADQRNSKKETREIATQSDLLGSTIGSYKDEIQALRGFLSTKDDEISRLQNENIEIKMPKPIYQSSPNDALKNKSKRMKAPSCELTPPTSDHHSGGEESLCESRPQFVSLVDRLNKTRELTRTLTRRFENSTDDYELRQVISSLDDMHQIMYKLQSSNEIESSKNENLRLKQKVTKLEALLARSCERLRSNNVLKHGLEYQMTSKLQRTAGILARARTNLGTSTPATSSRATSLNGDMESC